MTALVYIVGFCIVAVLVYMGRYSGRLRVSRTRVIDAPLAQVRAHVIDLRCWRDWNPGLGNEPDAEVAFPASTDGTASLCTWRRGGVEVGRIENLRARDEVSIEQRIRLKRPFPWRGRGSWRFGEFQGKTEVTWRLRGRVGFTMRAFADTVQGSIALDCRHGLDRLAGLLEPAEAPRYALSFDGAREVEAMRYAYIAHEGSIEGLAAAIEGVVNELRARLAAQGVLAEHAPIGVYVKTDIKRRTTLCRFGLPIGAAEVEGLDVATLPAHRAFSARLHGSRAQLEVAWYLLMQRLSAEGIPPDLRTAPFECYLGGTSRGDANDTVTELHIAIR